MTNKRLYISADIEGVEPLVEKIINLASTDATTKDGEIA